MQPLSSADPGREVEVRQHASCAGSSGWSRLLCFRQELLDKALHQWRTSNLSAWKEDQALAISSTMDSSIRTLKGVAIQLKAYWARVDRYLEAARSFERTLYESDHSTPQQQVRSVAPASAREEVITAIADRAGLPLEDVPYLALMLERGVRKHERWKLGEPWSTRVHYSWQQFCRRFHKWGVQGAIVVACCIVLMSGPYLRPLIYLLTIAILWKLGPISTWLTSF